MLPAMASKNHSNNGLAGLPDYDVLEMRLELAMAVIAALAFVLSIVLDPLVG